MNHINWEYKYFTGNLVLYLDYKIFGNIKLFSTLKCCIGSIRDLKLVYFLKGVFSNRVMIIDSQTNSPKGEIKLHYGLRKAVIKLNTGEKFQWRKSLFSGINWRISNENNRTVYCESSLKKRAIYFQEMNEILIISGLFIWAYYLKMILLLIILVMLSCCFVF